MVVKASPPSISRTCTSDRTETPYHIIQGLSVPPPQGPSCHESFRDWGPVSIFGACLVTSSNDKNEIMLTEFDKKANRRTWRWFRNQLKRVFTCRISYQVSDFQYLWFRSLFQASLVFYPYLEEIGKSQKYRGKKRDEI